MKYRLLGKTGLRVSEIGFGGWAIGGTGYGPTRDEDSLEALEAAWDAGVNFYDTADVYGDGRSEKLLARFLKNKPKDEKILATKAGWDFYHGGNKKNFNPDYIRFACEESLKRLETETIDLYQLHNPPLELIESGAAVDVLAKLKEQGKIRFIGISIHKESEAMAAMKDSRVDTLQLVFNLLDQRMAVNVFPQAKEKRVGLIVREPLANGLLTDKYKPGHKFDRVDHRNRWMPEKLELDLKKVEKFKAIIATQRLSLTRAALEYALDFEEIGTLIPGAKTKAQIKENVMASAAPQLRIEESYHLREIYQREAIFKEGLQSI